MSLSADKKKYQKHSEKELLLKILEALEAIAKVQGAIL